MVAVRWYLRYGLSYRDVEELLAERGIEVDHVTVYRWVQRFTPLFADAARPLRHAPGDRWFVDETYVKVAGGGGTCTGRSTSTARSSTCCCPSTARHRRGPPVLHPGAGTLRPTPVEVTTDQAPVRTAGARRAVPAARHHVEQYANNPVEADHGRLKARLRPMRGLNATAPRRRSRGHAFMQNLRRGHYELATDGSSPLAWCVTAARDLLLVRR